MKTIIALCFFILICPWDFLPAQAAVEDSHLNIPKNIELSHFTVEDGLPSNNVTAVRQDFQGFIWIGTNDAGLSKFDGIEFKNYAHIPNDPDSIYNNCAWRLYLDKKGNLWVVTWGGGVSRYDPARDRFITYSHDEDDPKSLPSNFIWCVFVDSSDGLWVGTGDGLSKYDKEKKEFIHFRHVADDPASISHNEVTMILEASGGFLWMSTYGGGLNKFDLERGTFTRYRHKDNDPHSLGNDFIWNMHRDKDGTLWIGTEGGLDKFDPKTETFTHYRHDEEDTHSIGGVPVTSTMRDSKGRLWAATDGHGINLHDPKTETFQRIIKDLDNPDSLSDNVVWDFFEDASGAIWIPTFNGLDYYDAAALRFKHFQRSPGNTAGLSDNSIQSFAEGKEGKLWIGTRGGGLNMFDPVKQTYTHYLYDPNNPDSLSSNTVLDFAQSQDGVLWIGTPAGIDRFDPENKTFKRYQHNPNDPATLTHGEIRSIDIAQDGSLWIGSYGGGLDRFDPVSQKFTHFKPEQDNPNSLLFEWIFVVFIDSFGKIWVGTEKGVSCLDPEKMIFTNYLTGKMDLNTRAIYQDKQGTIWLGTNGGLKQFNPKSQTFTEYNMDDGLAGGIAESIIEDNQGFLWIGTNNGLSKFDPQKKVFRNFDVRDGLQSNQFRRNAVYKSQDGELFFGGSKGFNSFSPEKFIDNPRIPPVVLTDFQLFHQPVGIGGDSPLQQHISLARQITLSHEHEVFSFSFAALNYQNSKKNQYAYMMEGFDKDFTYTDSTDPHARYTCLAPGEYTFMVKGSNNDGIWNEQGTSIKITILPPWWETVWFRILSLAGLVGLIWALFQHRLESANAHRQELELEITERRQTEEALRESKNQFKGLTSNIPGIVYRCLCDEDWTMRYISDYVEEITGYPSSDLIDNRVRSFNSIIHPEDSQKDRKIILDAIERKEPYEHEYRIIKADGTICWVYENGRAVFGDNGEVLWLDGAIFDITERKRADKELKEQYKLTNDIIESSLDAIIVADSQGVFTQTNKAYQKLLGFSKKELIGKQSAELSPREEGPYESTTGEIIQIDEAFKHSLKTMNKELNEKKYVYNWKFYLLRKDRKVVPVEQNMALLKDINGETFGAVGIIRDITERKQLEDNLRQSQKMEAVGTLAGGIAHDFNNILGGIVGYAELAQDDLSTNSPVQEYLSGILESSKRAKNLVKQILAFSRKSTEERKPLLVYPIIKEATRLIRSTVSATIEIKLNIDESSGMANADPTQIHQIVMNLCTNAVHSMQETGGALGIDLSCIDLKDKNMESFHYLKPEPHIMLKISDTGSGIDPDTLPRIFEPFFTTKTKERGTGMGLSVVHGIVKSYGGDIIADSQVGKGSTFTVFLPQVVAEPEKEEETMVAIPQGTECILFVDDEKTLLDTGKKMLQSLGYTVAGCDNSLEALKIFQQTPEKFDIVITDQAMPHMTGYDLSKIILEIKPTVPVILCTGYSDSLTPEKVEDAGIKALLYKPISKKEIAKTVREILDKHNLS